MGEVRRLRPGTVLRIVIADDHRLLLEGVQALLEKAADIEVVGATHESTRVLPLVAELEPDLLLLDFEMPGMDGLALLGRLQASYPAVDVVLLAESRDPELAARALEQGAKAVIDKSSDSDALAPALRAIIRGEIPAAGPPPALRPAQALGLTRREESVLLAMGRGLSNKEIARELSITKGTVTFHLHHIYEKLGVSTRLEALRALVERALFGDPYNWL